jgi:hypothetical protein
MSWAAHGAWQSRRATAGSLRSPGLIWVGSEAESGAQIAVNSVRGDVVLWLDDQVRHRACAAGALQPDAASKCSAVRVSSACPTRPGSIVTRVAFTFNRVRQALSATAFVKDGVRRPCSFVQLQQASRAYSCLAAPRTFVGFAHPHAA